MTDASKNILITPNSGVATVFPKIEFTGFDANTLTLSVLDDGTLSVDGSTGQLFSVSDSFTGTIFSVNDISGIPSIEVLDDGTVKLAEFGGDVTIGTNATIGGTVAATSYTETVFAVTGTTPVLDPVNGGVQTWALSGVSTPTENLTAGENMTLMIDDGTARTITWPTITWVNNGGTAPTLATTGYTVVALWKVSTTLYGALVGDGS
jgi:hypothetical protein